MHLLMEGTPDDIELPTIAARLAEIEGVQDIHHIHGWALTSGRYVFSAHIRVTDQKIDPDDILKAAHGILKDEFGFFFSTIQIETTCLDERHAEEIDRALS